MEQVFWTLSVALFAFVLGGIIAWWLSSGRCNQCLTVVCDKPEGATSESLFLSDVSREIDSARAKHPGNAHLLVALMEEVGELAKAHLEYEGPDRIWAEAKQVACVAARIALEFDADFPLYEVVQVQDIPSEGFFPDSFSLSPPSRAHVLEGIRAGRAAA